MEGGVADFTAILATEMTSQGAEVHVLTSRRAASSQRAALHGPWVHPLMMTWGWQHLHSATRQLLDEISPDVINVQFQTAAYGMHPATNFLPRLFPRIPVVVTFHDLRVPYLFPKAGALRWWANRTLARSCRSIIVTNEEDRVRLSSESGMPTTAVIPIGSNIAAALPPGYSRDVWRDGWSIPPSALLLCYFGFLNASKGGEELIDALDRVVQRGCDAYLLMLGGAVGASDPTNESYLTTVEWLIERNGVASRVIWTGHLGQEEISAGLTSADLCVLPYRDGISFRRGSLMAALRHGAAVLSTYPTLPLEGLRHGHNVWLTDRADADALAEGIMHLAGDAPLRSRLGHGARELSRRFSWERIAARTLEVCREAAQRQR